MEKRALVVIDLQKEYLAGGKLPLHEIDAAIQKAVLVIDDARQKDDKVIHIRHEQPGGPVFVAGSKGAEIVSSAAPRPGETVIVKNYPNAFRETELKRVLDENGIKEVVIIGAMSHMCVNATARAAADQGYLPTIVHDACATMDLEFEGVRVLADQVHAANMAALAFAYGKVVSAAEVIAT